MPRQQITQTLSGSGANIVASGNSWQVDFPIGGAAALAGTMQLIWKGAGVTNP